MSLIRQAITRAIPLMEEGLAKCKPAVNLLKKTLQQQSPSSPMTKGQLHSSYWLYGEPHVPGRLGLSLVVNRGYNHSRLSHSLSRNVH